MEPYEGKNKNAKILLEKSHMKLKNKNAEIILENLFRFMIYFVQVSNI